MANIINKGIKTQVIARGGLFIEGKEYACTLYQNVRKQTGRATTTAIAGDISGKLGCLFIFDATETAKLPIGNVTLEVYDNETFDRMAFVEKYATVRATSLSS